MDTPQFAVRKKSIHGVKNGDKRVSRLVATAVSPRPSTQSSTRHRQSRRTSPLQAHVKSLQACNAAYTAPLAEDDKASQDATPGDTQLGVARAQWLPAFGGLYGDVQSMFPGRRALAESFFPERSKKADKPATGATAKEAAAADGEGAVRSRRAAANGRRDGGAARIRA